MHLRFATFCAFVLLAITLRPLHAGVIAQNEIAGQFAGTIVACGQSVHIPVGPSFSDIGFSFGEYNTGVPLASADATLYLLAQEYLGPANALSSSTAGYIASTSAIQPLGSGQEWVFDAAVTLLPDTAYWFYMDRPTNTTDPFMGVVSITTDTYAGGNFYYSYPADMDYVSDDDADLVFQLNGTAVPEPAAVVLLLVATMSIAAFKLATRSLSTTPLSRPH